VRGGADPIADKRNGRAQREAKAALLVGAVLERYAELHLSKLADGKRRRAQLRAALADFRALSVDDFLAKYEPAYSRPDAEGIGRATALTDG
jgi:hypothetical protein